MRYILTIQRHGYLVESVGERGARASVKEFVDKRKAVRFVKALRGAGTITPVAGAVSPPSDLPGR